MCFGKSQDYEGATVTWVRGVDVPGIAFWHDSGRSRRNIQLIRGVGVPRIMFSHASGSSSGCLPARQFNQQK
eukprot:9069500-Pyramimonas_sp.AAC.1